MTTALPCSRLCPAEGGSFPQIQRESRGATLRLAEGAMPTSLWWEAAERGDVRSLTSMLESGEPVDTQDPDGLTALHLATLHNRVDAVVLLLTYGANPSHQEARWGGTPLHRAAINGEVRVARALLVAKADTAAMYPGNHWTPLHEAAMHDHAPVASMLLDAGADRDALTLEQDTPLDLALKHGHSVTAATLRTWKPPYRSTSKPLHTKQRPPVTAAAAVEHATLDSTALMHGDLAVLGSLLVTALVPFLLSRLCCPEGPRLRGQRQAG